MDYRTTTPIHHASARNAHANGARAAATSTVTTIATATKAVN